MGDVVNLNRYRKARERRETEVKSALNRAAFGRPKDEKQNARLLLEKSRRDLDRKLLEDHTPDDEPPKAG